jgi:hypothetical protein
MRGGKIPGKRGNCGDPSRGTAPRLDTKAAAGAAIRGGPEPSKLPQSASGPVRIRLTKVQSGSLAIRAS